MLHIMEQTAQADIPRLLAEAASQGLHVRPIHVKETLFVQMLEHEPAITSWLGDVSHVWLIDTLYDLSLHHKCAHLIDSHDVCVQLPRVYSYQRGDTVVWLQSNNQRHQFSGIIPLDIPRDPELAEFLEARPDMAYLTIIHTIR